MNQAIRMGIAAAFGVAAAIPSFAQFENTGPDPRPGQGASSLSDVPPPGLSGGDSQYGSDARRHHAGRYYRSMNGKGLEWSTAESSNQFGSPAGDMFYDREIRLGSNPGSIGVTHGETVKFVMADGHEFRWRFDTLKRVTAFPLARIAPSEVSVGRNPKVYVNGEDNNLQG